ncbi:MFS transporter [Lactococcus allomyrinae]|uniref:MFS transporter n=2 Tax=Lactococcus allomyrinae TaxID=2419773 RepID=A0A387BIW2_9LACT|nr:MFS transporter [Lactococcus allomyrinae]
MIKNELKNTLIFMFRALSFNFRYNESMTTQKISTFLIFIVFIIFISLGLPDSVMGSAWPAIRQTYSFPIDMIGILGAIQLGFSFCSTILYPKLAKIWTMDKFIIFSTLLTILGLATLGLGSTFFTMLLSCILLGFGQGSVDITVNDFAAKHFSNSLMNFLHAFYGVGVMASSFIVAFSLQPHRSWQLGVAIISFFQILILILAILTRSKFKEKTVLTSDNKLKDADSKLKLSHFILPLFYFFYALELLIGRFYSSFAVEHLHFSMAAGAAITSFYWTGLTIGRFMTGFTARWFSTQTIILFHLSLLILGIILGFIPQLFIQYLSGTLLGLGLAPLYPMGMKQTYNIYSDSIAKRVISLNIAFATIGMFIIPIPLGWIFEQFGFASYPFIIGGFGIILSGLCWQIYTKVIKK